MTSIPSDSPPLKIALLSYAFAPGVGGIETVSQLLVDGLRARGHQVRVLTQTPATEGASDGSIVRRPTAGQLLAALRWSDAVIQSNVSLALAWPLSLGLVRRPWVVVNHTPISRPSGVRTWRDRLKLVSLGRARVYAVSEYLRSVTLPASRVMRNPYDIVSFYLPTHAEHARDRELLFVGRIVRAKGLDVLVEALHLLKQQRGLTPRLSVAGGGEERAAIEARTVQLGLQAQVEWLGVLRGTQLGDAMRRATVMVVPSRPEPPEALPLVPLEAVASGCVVIASRQGGLPESVGPCGLLVAPEDPQALADAIFELLAAPALQQRLRDAAAAHLEPFHPAAVVTDYETALREAAAALR